MNTVLDGDLERCGDLELSSPAFDDGERMPEQTRKARLGSAIAMNAAVMAATQLVGTYHADQGTAI